MKKISVMIVDDEKLAIEDLTSIVSWDALGFEIVATAVNGKQALSKFQQLRPQVVFTDIKMPFMDGIELIGHLRELDEHVKILLLTAYEDFSYAKSAIQYGITEYIIKSEIRAATFTATLCKLRKAIDTADREQDILRDKLISDFFLSGAQTDDVLFSKPYHYLLIEQDLPVNLLGDEFPARIRHAKTELLGALMAQDGAQCRIAAASSTPRGQILLVVSTNEVSQSAVQTALRQYALEKKVWLEDRFQCYFTFYTAAGKRSLPELKRLYCANSWLFGQKYFSGCGNICDLAEQRAPMQAVEPAPSLAPLESNIEALDEAGVEEYLSKTFCAICAAFNYDALVSTCRALYTLLRRSFDALPDYVENANLTADDNWWHWLDAQRLQKWFSCNFAALLRAKAEVSRHGYSRPIVRAISFIYQRYPDSELSINQVSDHVHLSTGHLCALFKKETGKTLKNYITEVRIVEAKRLLDEGRLKVYEISSAVGYQSSQYFSQVFYKQAGVYPTEYGNGRKPEALTGGTV